MGMEIEHKYLVKNDSYKSQSSAKSHILQGYLCREPERTVRVRVRDDKGFLTVKGKNSGAGRLEFEYEIPLRDAAALLGLCIPPVLDKTRYIVPYCGHIWEVDEFHGDREGLVTAEVELKSESESYPLPDFVGADVTGDPRYYNSNL